MLIRKGEIVTDILDNVVIALTSGEDENEVYCCAVNTYERIIRKSKTLMRYLNEDKIEKLVDKVVAKGGYIRQYTCDDLFEITEYDCNEDSYEWIRNIEVGNSYVWDDDFITVLDCSDYFNIICVNNLYYDEIEDMETLEEQLAYLEKEEIEVLHLDIVNSSFRYSCNPRGCSWYIDDEDNWQWCD